MGHGEPVRTRCDLAVAEQVRALTEFERIKKATAAYHRHQEIEVNLFLKGEGVCICGGRRLAVRAGTLLWVSPGTDHVLDEPSNDLDVWVINARPRVLERAASGQDARRLLGSPFELRALALPQARQLASVFEDVRAQVGRNRYVFNEGLAYAVARTFTALSGPTEAPGEESVHPAVLRAARMLREDPRARRLGAVARRSGLSADHLTRLFAVQMGLSMTQFRNRARVERFLELYGAGRRYSLTEAALEAGFGSYAQFQRVFKKHCGCSPAEYARRLREKGACSHGSPEA